MTTSLYTPEELAQIEADLAWWQEFADAIGWRLSGITLRRDALFYDSSDRSVSVTGTQRDDIMRAIRGRQAQPERTPMFTCLGSGKDADAKEAPDGFAPCSCLGRDEDVK